MALNRSDENDLELQPSDLESSQAIQKWIVYLNITSDVLFVPDSERTVPVLNVSPVT